MAKLRDIQRTIEASAPAIEKLAQDAIVVHANDTLGQILQRIFNQGKDATGQKIGEGYSERYAELRESEGLQTQYVDLQRTGDLFNSIQAVVTEGKLTIGIVNNKTSRISIYLEDRYKKDIFKASPQETEAALEAMRDYFMAGLLDIMKGWQK